MIIEDLIRLGKPLLDGGMSAKEILELITDVNDEKVKNFFRHIFVVELPPEGSTADPIVLPMQVWGQEVTVEGKAKRVDFLTDSKRALGAPFGLPAGGNPLHPQGSYGVPVYPCWLNRKDKKTKEWVFTFSNPAAVRLFLNGRLERTSDTIIDDAMCQKLGEVIYEQVAPLEKGKPDKAILGLIILTQCVGKTAPYAYNDQPDGSDLGQSKLQQGKFIVPRFERIMKAVWAAKFEEGASMGNRQGTCSICSQGEKVVSYYCKAWPWALPEWTCPLPQGGDEKLMVEGIALDEPCYRALILGASIFRKFTKPIHWMVTRELFSPVADREGRNTASRRKLSEIQGSAYLLPLHDEALTNEDLREAFISGVNGMLSFPSKEGVLLDRYMDAVTGFDVFLPEEMETVDFRLMLAYFHGNVGRGDIHLRALIQDVIPSTLRQLKEIARTSAETAIMLLKALSPDASQKNVAYHRTIYRSVPYMLARAYGGSYLWHQLEASVRRRPLDAFRPTFNAAHRMNSLSARYPDTRFDLNDEVIFYLTFLDFLSKYNEQIASGPDLRKDRVKFNERSLTMAMRPWKELLKAVSEGVPENLRYDSPAELGFGCGVLLRQFGRWYWNATKVGKEGKDFLKHRVLTFGSDLSPDIVWKRGLAKVFDVAARYDKLHLSEDFRRRAGVTLAEFDRLQERLHSNRDAFMSAFWSGHALQGYDKQEANSTISATPATSFEEAERSAQ